MAEETKTRIGYVIFPYGLMSNGTTGYVWVRVTVCSTLAIHCGYEYE
jgi:hypothetical protein